MKIKNKTIIIYLDIFLYLVLRDSCKITVLVDSRQINSNFEIENEFCFVQNFIL